MLETIFYSYHDFMLAGKTVTYILMGSGLILLLGYWRFLTGRDEPIRKY